MAIRDDKAERGCLVVFLFAVSALMLLMAVLPDTGSMHIVEGGRVVFFLVAVGVSAIAIALRRHAKAADTREKSEKMERVSSRAEYYRSYLSANAMVGTYKGGHPDICRKATVLLEIESDAVKVTPAVLRPDGSELSRKIPQMQEPEFKAHWDWSQSVHIPFAGIEFIQSETSSTTVSQQKDPLGRAVVGGAIAGEVGAVVGAVSGLQDRKLSFASEYLYIKFREPGASEAHTLVVSVDDNYLNFKWQGLTGISFNDPDMKDYLAGFTPFPKKLQVVHDEFRRRQRSEG